jgi:integrase
MQSKSVAAATTGCAACERARIGIRAMQSKVIRDHVRYMQMRGLAEGTIARRLQTLQAIATFTGAPLADITEEQLLEWADSLRGRHKRATRSAYISHVRTFYAWAYFEGHYPSDPARRLVPPDRPRTVPRPIAEDKLAYALDIAPARLRIWLVLAAWGGLRACEIALLEGQNVRLDVAEPYIHIVTDATKGLTERIVPVTPAVAAELAKARLPLRGPCWLKADGGEVPPNLVSKVCNQHLHACGIEDTLHSLRHRFLTELVRGSGNLRVAQEVAGHASPMTTAGYAKVAAVDARAAVLTVPQLPMRAAAGELPTIPLRRVEQ